VRLSHDEYALLVEQAPILVWRSDTTGLCDYFNDRWLEFRGRTLEEERGEGWAQGVHPEDLDRCLQIYRNAFTRRETFEMEYRLARRDGVYRWIFDRGVPIYRCRRTFPRLYRSCIDVTARVRRRPPLGASATKSWRTCGACCRSAATASASATMKATGRRSRSTSPSTLGRFLARLLPRVPEARVPRNMGTDGGAQALTRGRTWTTSGR